MNTIRQIIGIVIVTIILSSCGSDTGPLVDAYDRTSMLTKLADEVIVPSYDSTRAALSELRSSFEQAVLDGNVSTTDVDVLRRHYLNAVRRWQCVVTYNFGPAEGNLGTLAQEIATFPCDTAAVEQRIASGDTSTTNFRRDTRGFAGLDYMLFARSAEQVSKELSGPESTKRRDYLHSVLVRADNDLSAVTATWKSSYRAVFISRNLTDAGSSVSLLLNELNKSFELLKNYKLGLPLGLRAGQTMAEPAKIESYYCGVSYELLGLHYRSIKEIWSGRLSNGAQIPSFRSYLLTVVNGPRLIEETEAQFARIDAAYGMASQSNMSEQIRTNPQALVALHTEMQKLTRFIKSEMSSLLGISITYSSGDGD